MNAAFVVHLNLDDTTDLGEEAQHLHDVLLQNGVPVTSVDPWARPSTAPSLADITRAAFAANTIPAQAGSL